MYKNHYAALEDECKRQGRAALHWTVEDGWGSLCEFLGKPVPKKDFPNENDQNYFAKRTAAVQVQRMARARRNAMIAGVILSAALGSMLAWYVFE